MPENKSLAPSSYDNNRLSTISVKYNLCCFFFDKPIIQRNIWMQVYVNWADMQPDRYDNICFRNSYVITGPCIVCEKLFDVASYTNLLQTFSQMSMKRDVRSLISLMEMRAQRHIRVRIQILVTRSAWRNDLKKCENSKSNKCFTILLLMNRFITVYSPFFIPRFMGLLQDT